MAVHIIAVVADGGRGVHRCHVQPALDADPGSARQSPRMTPFLMLVLKACVLGMVAAIGMASKPGDVAYLLRRPALLLRSLLAMYVLVPAVALAIVSTLPLTPSTKAALLVLAVSAGAPLLPRKLLFLARGDYVFALALISAVLAVAVAPAWVSLMAAHFDVAVEMTPGRVAGIVAKAFLLPLGAGMLVRAWAPAWSARVADRLLAVLGAVMLACAFVLLATHLDLLAQIRPGDFLALALMMVLALAIGHLCGGPDADDRTALAIACATRHLGIAVLVAAAFPGPRTTVVMLGYLLAALLVTMPYLRGRKRSAAGPRIA
jgi:predicted Na+-dependent transporter